MSGLNKTEKRTGQVKMLQPVPRSLKTLPIGPGRRDCTEANTVRRLWSERLFDQCSTSPNQWIQWLHFSIHSCWLTATKTTPKPAKSNIAIKELWSLITYNTAIKIKGQLPWCKHWRRIADMWCHSKPSAISWWQTVHIAMQQPEILVCFQCWYWLIWF